MTKRKIIILGTVGVLLVAGGWKLNDIRLEVGGLRNMLSITYWKAVFNHTNLYAPNARMLKHGNPNLKEIAITIDDGPHPKSCGVILDILKRENVHATFFPVGIRIKQHPDLIWRMVNEGNEVGNHTQDHLRLTTLRTDQMAKELEFCERNFNKATGRKLYLMRPPGMNFNDAVLAEVKKLGYIMVNWTSAAKDFVDLAHVHEVDPKTISDRVLKEADNGGIILIHDAPDTAQALPAIIDSLKAKGYKIVTISEMLAHLPDPVHIPTNAGPYPAGTVPPVPPPEPVAKPKPAAKKGSGAAKAAPIAS
jgi:peptidoglycan/xylan/chitin deacetylase (PgdA/CDA1 family)